MRTASKRILLLWAACACASAATAQYETTAQSAREGALGGVVLFEPAGRCVALDWGRAWMQAEQAAKSLRLQLPVGDGGTLRLAYEHRGTVDYHEQQLAAAYALRVSEWLRVGVSARGLHLGTSDAHYAPHRWLAAAALLQASAGRTTLTLLAGSRPWDEVATWRLHLQAAYRPSDRWLTVVELEREEVVRWRMGMEYAAAEYIRLRAGLATRPTLLTLGVGFRWAQFELDLAARMHAALGVTPQISLALWF